MSAVTTKPVPARGEDPGGSRRRPARAGRRARRQGFDRPRFLYVVVALTFALLLVPIAVVLVFSFNAERSLATFGGVSLRWYRSALDDGDLMGSLWTSVKIAVVATVVSTALGTLLAFGLERGSRIPARASDTMILLRLVSPETATAVAAFLLFTQMGVQLSQTTVVLSHVAFCLAFVTVVVRSRLVALNPEVEAAAMDLGATRLQALRLVALPLLWPSILAAAMLSFVLSFDDFITSFFTSGLGVPPLPVRIYAMIKYGVTPVVNALGVLMVAVTLLAVGLGVLVQRTARPRQVDFTRPTEAQDG